MSLFRTQIVVAMLIIVTHPSGAYWNPLGLDADISKIGYTNGWYFIMTGNGLYRTDDPYRATVFEKVGPSMILQTPIVGINGYLVTRTSGGYLESKDLGRTWKRPQTFPNATLQDELFANDRYLFILQWNALHRSSDLGATWERIELSDYYGVVNRRMLRILPSGKGYSQGVDYSIWETVDHGRTWTEVRKAPLYGSSGDLWVSTSGRLYLHERPTGAHDSFFSQPLLEVSGDGGRSFTSMDSEQTIGVHTFADAGGMVIMAITEYGWNLFNGSWTRSGVVRPKSADFWGRVWLYMGHPFDYAIPSMMVSVGGCVFASTPQGTCYVYEFKKTVTHVEVSTDTDASCKPEIRRELNHATIINPCSPALISVYDLLGRHIADHHAPTGSSQVPITADQFIMVAEASTRSSLRSE